MDRLIKLYKLFKISQGIIASIIVLILTPLSLMAGNTEVQEQVGPILNDTEIFFLFVTIITLFIIVIMAQAGAIKALVSNKDKWVKGGKALLVTGLLVWANQANAAVMGSETDPMIVMSDTLYAVMISITAFLFGVIICLHYVHRNLMKGTREEEAKAESKDFFEVFQARLTDAVPVEQEGEVMMDHAYDGIRELDNNLPPWWKYGFYISIVWAVWYLFYFHFTGAGDLMYEEYRKAMIVAEEEKAAYLALKADLVDEKNVELLVSAGDLKKGEEVFMSNCIACHGKLGEGVAGLGPNLTDEYWKNKGGIKNVFKTIKYGVPEKGMQSWKDLMSPSQMQHVASYIISLQGSNPPNAVEPQGELWKEEAEEGTESPADSLEVDTLKVSGTKVQQAGL